MDIEALGNQILALQEKINNTHTDLKKLSEFPADLAALIGNIDQVIDHIQLRAAQTEVVEERDLERFAFTGVHVHLSEAQAALRRISARWAES